MDITTLTLLYYSPTKTTKKIVEAVALGFQATITQHIDMTKSESASLGYCAGPDELVILASPVYGGRLPVAMLSRLQGITGRNAPTVVVVTYGNRAYEDALLELRDLAQAAGFQPVGAGAFIGEHSFSNARTPIAVGRPDQNDLQAAVAFGKQIREKLDNCSGPDALNQFHVPGNYPYKERGLSSNIAPVTNLELCCLCKACEKACPTAAISVECTVVTDASSCTRCCACIKICSTGARTMDDPRMLQVAQWLFSNFSERKEPEMYL